MSIPNEKIFKANSLEDIAVMFDGYSAYHLELARDTKLGLRARDLEYREAQIWRDAAGLVRQTELVVIP